MTARYRQGPAVLDVERRITADGSRLPEGWVKAAAKTVRTIAALGREFTIADLKQAGVPEPPHQGHWGSLMRKLHTDGLIRPAGLTLELATDGCTRPTRVWAATPKGGATTG